MSLLGATKLLLLFVAVGIFGVFLSNIRLAQSHQRTPREALEVQLRIGRVMAR